MANTSISVSTRVADAPVTSPIAGSLNLAPTWQRWFASVGTWIANANSAKSGTIGDGQYRTAVVGRVATFTCTLTAANGTVVYPGLTLKPILPTALACGKLNICAVLGTDGTLTVTNGGPATSVVISGAVLTAPTKET